MTENQPAAQAQNATLALPQPDITPKDYKFAIVAGLLIGLLFMPILRAAKPDLYTQIWLAIVPFFFVATPLGMRIAFFIGKKISIVPQIAKFGVSGVLNTFVDLGILSLLEYLSIRTFGLNPENPVASILPVITFYSIYKAASFIIANINSFLWNKYWTFSDNSGEKTQAKFIQFFVISILGFLINVSIASYVFKLVRPEGFSMEQWGLAGAAFGSLASLAWNFIGYKFWVFKK